ncbi:MAG: acylphosphatase [Pseudomonadota bacterium]
MNVTTKHLIIYGYVQGVGYRAWVIEGARRLGLTGWVRNRAEGTVEAVFVGKRAAVLRMVEACRQGPDRARVTGVDSIDWIGDVPTDFRQLPTD